MKFSKACCHALGSFLLPKSATLQIGIGKKGSLILLSISLPSSLLDSFNVLSRIESDVGIIELEKMIILYSLNRESAIYLAADRFKSKPHGASFPASMSKIR